MRIDKNINYFSEKSYFDLEKYIILPPDKSSSYWYSNSLWNGTISTNSSGDSKTNNTTTFTKLSNGIIKKMRPITICLVGKKVSNGVNNTKYPPQQYDNNNSTTSISRNNTIKGTTNNRQQQQNL